MAQEGLFSVTAAVSLHSQDPAQATRLPLQTAWLKASGWEWLLAELPHEQGWNQFVA